MKYEDILSELEVKFKLILIFILIILIVFSVSMNEIEKDLHELKFNNIEKLEIMINNIEIRINEIEKSKKLMGDKL